MKIVESSRRRVLAGVVVLFLAGGAAWYWWPEDEVAKVKALRDAVRAEGLSPEERRAKWGELRQAMRNLSPQDRMELSADRRKAMVERMNNYFHSSPAEKAQMAKENQQRRAAWQGAGGPGGGGPPGGGGGPGGGGPGGWGGRNGGGNGQPPSAQQMDQGRQNRLDMTNAAERNMMTQYREDMRRLGGGGGGGGRPPGR
jgi:hypothetical protein